MLNPGAAGGLDPAAARAFAAAGYGAPGGQGLPLGMQGTNLANVRANLAGLGQPNQAGLQATNAQANRFAAAQVQNLQSNLQQQLAGQFAQRGAPLGNANLANGVLGGNAAAAAVAAAGVRVGGALAGLNNPSAMSAIRPAGVDRGNLGLANLGAAGMGQQNLGVQGFQQLAALQQQAATNQLQQRLAGGLGLGQNLGQGNIQQQLQQNARMQNLNNALNVNMMQQSIAGGNAQGQDLLAMLGRNKAATQSVLGNDAYTAILQNKQQPQQGLGQAQQAGRQPGLQGQDFNVAAEDFPALPGAAPRGDDAGARNAFGGLQGNAAAAAAALGRGGYMLGADQYGAAGLGDVSRAQAAAAGLNDYDALLRFQQQQQQAGVAAAAAAQRAGGAVPGGVGKPGMPGVGPQGGLGADAGGPKPGQGPLGPPPDKWGLLAIMPLLKMTDQDATTLELGINLTTLGLDLTSPSSLHKSLVTPLSSQPIKAEPEFDLPACYKHVPQRLHAGYLSKFKDETLFYIFYSMPGDEAQIVAADELAVRNWVFHKRLRMWMTPAPNAPPPVKTPRGERGNYLAFNPAVWDYDPKQDFEVSYEELEVPPRLARAGPQQRPPQGPGGQPQPGPGQQPGQAAPGGAVAAGPGQQQGMAAVGPGAAVRA